MCSFLYIGRINSSFYCFTCGTLVYYPDSRQCSVHLINKGVTIENNNATIEFAGTGPSEENVVSVFVCQLDGGSFSTCKNFKSYHKCQCYWHQLSVSTTATNWLLTLISPGQIQTLQLLKACIKAVGRKGGSYFNKTQSKRLVPFNIPWCTVDLVVFKVHVWMLYGQQQCQ